MPNDQSAKLKFRFHKPKREGKEKKEKKRQKKERVEGRKPRERSCTRQSVSKGYDQLIS